MMIGNGGNIGGATLPRNLPDLTGAGDAPHVGALEKARRIAHSRTPAVAVSQEKPLLQVLLCSPRGFCAGVVRAIESVERALAIKILL